MAGTITTTNSFATQSGPIPLSQLDANFTNVNSSINNLNIYSNYYADSSLSANTITVTTGGSQTVSYAAGLTIAIKVNNTNTGATTINVNSLGAKSLVTGTSTALNAGAITSGQIVVAIYDGTNFQLQGVFSGEGNFASIDVSGAANLNGTVTLGAGTANGVLYLNGSKVVSSGSAVTYNGTTFSTSADASIHGLTVGQGAGSVSTNTAVGASALAANTTGGSNTALGNYALYNNTTASNNTAVGYQAGYSNASGAGSTFIGYQAGYSSAVVSASAYNCFVGGNSGYYITTGTKNTIIGGYNGNQGGLDIRTASNYIVLSDGDGNPRGIFNSSGQLLVGTTSPTTGYLMSLSGNLVLSAANPVIAWNYGGPQIYTTGANTLMFSPNGAPSQSMTLNPNGYLLVGYTTSNGSYDLQVNSQIFATNATIATSDANYKTNVTPIASSLSLINALNPVTFNWKPHPVHNFNTDIIDVGFLAQEVQQVLVGTPYIDSIIKKNETTLPDGTQESFLGFADVKFIPLLVKAIQELSSKLKAANIY